jgi:cobalt-zinc-cadmium efflux system protein
VLGSVITTVILLVGSLVVTYNAIGRIVNPAEINYNGMIAFAVVGTVVNFVAAFFTKDADSLNQKSVNLHMLEDVLGWIAVLVGAIVMKFTDFALIDPVLSMCVAVFIFINALKNLKSLLDVFLEKTPVDIKEIKEHLMHIEGVVDVHHIHIRSLDGVNNFATLHVVAKGDFAKIKKDVKEELSEHGISHTTVEMELPEEQCDDVNCKPCHTHGGHHHGHHHH